VQFQCQTTAIPIQTTLISIPKNASVWHQFQILWQCISAFKN
jgi:hypothetical protein